MPETWLTLTATEQAFISAAADTIIPADDLSPSGSDCGVAVFIDRQLAGAYGSGARLYRQGPFPKAKPELGYQLALTPREFFRAGIEAANELTRKTYGKDFDRLAEKDREAALKTLEEGKARLPRLQQHACSSTRCCRSRWRASSPTRCTAATATWPSWKMVGYPGLPATYREEIKTLSRQEVRQAAAVDRGLLVRGG